MHDFSSDDPPPSLFDDDVFGDGGGAPAPAPAAASASTASDGPPIATARVTLASLLSSNAELKKVRVALKPGDGSDTGSRSEAGALTLSTACLAGLRMITAEAASAAASTTLSVNVRTATITNKKLLAELAPASRGARGAGGGTLHVLIDMLGVGSLETKTKNVPVEASGTTSALALEQTYDVSSGTELRAAVVKALQSKGSPEDSEVQFVAVITDKAGKEAKEVGIGHVSLETLLADSREHDGALELFEPTGEKASIGKLGCAVKGLAALKLIADEAAGKPPPEKGAKSPRGAAPAPAASSAAKKDDKPVDVASLPSKHKMTFQLHTLTLGAKLKKKSPSHVRVWIDVPAGANGQLASSVQKGDGKDVKFAWTHVHGMAVGSTSRDDFYSIIANKDKEDKSPADVTFSLYGLTDKEAKGASTAAEGGRPEGSLLGKAKLNFIELMKLGDDVEEKKIELKSGMHRSEHEIQPARPALRGRSF